MSVQPLIWYKFDPANPTLNSGSLGSSGNLTLNANNSVVSIATSGQTLSGQTGCLRTTARCNVPLSFTVPASGRVAVSFWYKNISTTRINQIKYAGFDGVGETAFWSQYDKMNITFRNLYQQQINTDVSTPANQFDGNWHFFTFRSSGSNYYYRGDGSSESSYSNNRPWANYTLNDVHINGTSSSYYLNPFNGYISDFRVYSDVDDVFGHMYNIGKDTNIAGLSGVSIDMLIHSNATYSQLLVAGRTLSGLLAANYTVLQLYTIGATIAQLRDQRTTLQLIASGITIDNLLTYYTYTQLFDNESVTKTHFDSAGKTIQNVVSGGYTVPSKLLTAGYTVQQIASVPYTVTQMVNSGITFLQLLNGGVTSTQFTAENYTISNLVNGGATDAQLFTAGYTFAQFQSAGFLPAWSIDTSANHIIKSYVKDFIDVSGSIVLRENSNLYIHGNVETAGNLLLNRLVVNADANLNRSIFVGGDVSMNTKLTVRGDLSLTGSVTKCNLNNSSIPKSAFASTVPDGPDYTTSKIVYDQTFQANDDVSMNGLIVASNNVTVSGNIVFGDGTVMNAYDNNISTTNAPAFKPSTFTRLDICGNLVAGSYASLSDYRIKTNIMELDETYNVDKLRPVKYYQTQINREKYGLIAHELQEHYPDLVVGEKDGTELQRVNYMGLIAILINEIKRMKRELTKLENDDVVGR